MKLSNETLTVLKNFSSINQGIQFKKGKKLTTVSAGKTVLAQANLADEFPQDFCVYDLNEFLSVHSLFKDSDIDFTDSDIVFKSGKRKSNYRMTAANMIVTPPEKEITLPSVDCEFTLSAEDYDAIIKAANVLSSPHIGVRSDGETVEVIAFDAVNNAAHTNSIQVGEGNGKKYTIVFKSENIKLISGGYDVKISFKGIGHFKNIKDDIQYWIAFEAKETKIGE
jgi:hypothetical protein